MRVYKFKKMYFFIFLILLLAAYSWYFLGSAVFGSDPDTDIKKRIEKSVNYKNGVFQNQSPTEVMRPGGSYFETLRKFLNKPKDTEPSKPIETVKTDLKKFNPQEPTIIWFGHSSYILFIDGKKILVDPVFASASPVPFFGAPFKYSDNYHPDDFPEIDVIVISHDHYDHLDFKSITQLIPKTKHFLTPLGVESHLIKWGAKAENITSLDWYESATISNFNFTATPARHFSGRKFKRGNTLWASYVLQTNSTKIYLGGDSGLDKHYTEIGSKYGPFDLAILECGQYGDDWPNIHMFPSEVLLASKQLNARKLLPVHWGKFSLALHSWTAPIDSLIDLSKDKEIDIYTPRIGEPLMITKDNNTSAWWKSK